MLSIASSCAASVSPALLFQITKHRRHSSTQKLNNKLQLFLSQCDEQDAAAASEIVHNITHFARSPIAEEDEPDLHLFIEGNVQFLAATAHTRSVSLKPRMKLWSTKTKTKKKRTNETTKESERDRFVPG